MKGHKEEEGEVRTYEKMQLVDCNRVAIKAMQMLVGRVNQYEKVNNKVVSRLFIELDSESITCEAFYKDK